MVEDALAQGRAFGMIQPDPRGLAAARRAGLYKVGCLGRLTSFAETEDGRFLITLTGTVRFQVAGRAAEARRLPPGARATTPPFAADLEAPAPRLDRPALLAALRPYFRAKGIDANWEAIETIEDERAGHHAVHGLPLRPDEKQALLEAHRRPPPAPRC